METFRSVVENVESESLKNGYNPATGTNWTDLSMEIRVECLAHMDFLTRIHLRTTSSIEKHLVESSKMPFDTVRLRYESRFPDLLQIWTMSEMGSSTRKGACSKMMCFLDQILRFGQTSCLFLIFANMRNDSELDEIVSVLSRNKPLKLKILRLFSDRSSVLEKLLKIVEVEQIWVGVLPDSSLPFGYHMCYTTEQMSRTLREAVNVVVGKWIETDAEAGKLFRFDSMLSISQSISSYEEDFSSRVVWKSQKFIAIRMDDSTKRIYLSLGTINNKLQISGRVFPASFPESDELIMETMQSEFRQIKKYYWIRGQ